MISKVYVIKGVLTTIPLILGVVVVSAAQKLSAPQAASTQASTDTAVSAKSDPSPTPTTNIEVNGRHVPTDEHGNLDLRLPGSNAHIQVSDGQASVTTDNNNSSVTSGSGGNVEVKVQTDSTNGTSHSTTHITSSDTSRNGTTTKSSTSTHVFSTGSANVQTQP